MRRLATALCGLAIAVFVVGLGLALLIQPPVTRALAARFALAEEAGLEPSRMLDIAEQVRGFVAGSGGTLPAVVDGRDGFDAAAVSHLEDVRGVIRGGLAVTAGLAVALSLALGIALARRRPALVASSMRAGAWWCAGIVAVAVLAGVFSFEALFSAFHGVFFAEGTWTFPSDSLLIQTFPERFWAVAAGLWAGVVLVGAVLLGLAARPLAGREAPSAESSERRPLGHKT